MIILNKKAKFNYEFLEEIVAGIILLGSEVKSIRNGNVNLRDSFCYIKDNELYSNFHVSENRYSTTKPHDPNRPKKLLVTKNQLKNIKKKTLIKGSTIIPYSIFFNDRGLAKISLQIARGKKQYDKKESIKEKDIKRENKEIL